MDKNDFLVKEMAMQTCKAVIERFTELFPHANVPEIPENPTEQEIANAAMLRVGYWYAATNGFKNGRSYAAMLEDG